MKKALAHVSEQRLNPVSDDQDYTLKSKHLPEDYNGEKVLDDLSRKWVRYGCASTPGEALKVLLEGCNHE